MCFEVIGQKEYQENGLFYFTLAYERLLTCNGVALNLTEKVEILPTSLQQKQAHFYTPSFLGLE